LHGHVCGSLGWGDGCHYGADQQCPDKNYHGEGKHNDATVV